jgi:hypothetical protein
MTLRGATAGLAFVAVLCAATRVAGEPLAAPDAPSGPTVPETVDESLQLTTPSIIHTDGGANLRLPPGYFLTTHDYEILDVELQRLQDEETRLTAENDSLRQSAERPGAGLRTIVVVVGITLGLGIGLGAWAF